MDVIDKIDGYNHPGVFTITRLINNTQDSGLAEWLGERKNRRAIPYRLEKCGYVPVRNPGAKDGLWVVGGKRQAIYVRADLPPAQRVAAADAFVASPPFP